MVPINDQSSIDNDENDDKNDDKNDNKNDDKNEERMMMRMRMMMRIEKWLHFPLFVRTSRKCAARIYCCTQQLFSLSHHDDADDDDDDDDDDDVNYDDDHDDHDDHDDDDDEDFLFFPPKLIKLPRTYYNFCNISSASATCIHTCHVMYMQTIV